jgi:subtilisin-like proprotein convertase family protein
VRIKWTTLLAVAAGLLAMVVGGATIHAAVTQSSTDVPKTIPDGPAPGVTASVNSTLNFTVAGTITDANLTLTITHTFESDIELRLTRPGGTPVLVFGDCGGADDNFNNTTISDEGIAPNCVAGAGFAGTFQGAPTGAPNPTVMTAFDTFTSGGVWNLNVADDSPADTGTLTAWSLTLDGPPPLPVELMKVEVK